MIERIHPARRARGRRSTGRRGATSGRVAVAIVVVIATAISTVTATALAQPCAHAGDLAAARQARERIAAAGGVVWPGWNDPAPVLLRSGSGDCLVDHPDPPAGFELVGPGVQRRDGHLLPVPAATAWPVNDVWSVAIPAQDELQAFLDEHLGAGAVEIDAALYERAIVHEAFHAFQMTLLGGPDAIPAMGAERPGETLAALSDDAAAAAAHDAIGAALSAALDAGTADEALAALTDVIERRDAWWARAPAGVPGMERHLEWLEGTARYADVLIGVGAGGADVSTAAWRDLREQVAQPTAIVSGLRDRYAAFGAAQAFVLDRWAPGWKARALPGGTSLDALIRSLASDLAGS